MDQAQALAEYLRMTGGNMPGSGLSQMMMGRGQGPVMETANPAPQPAQQRPNDPLAPAYQGAAEGIVGMSPPAMGYGAGRAAGAMAQDPNGANGAVLAMSLFPMLRGKLGAFLRGKQEGMPAGDADRLSGLQEETYKRTIANEAAREAGVYPNGQPRPVPTVAGPDGHLMADPTFKPSAPTNPFTEIEAEMYAQRMAQPSSLPPQVPQGARPPGQMPQPLQSPPVPGATGQNQAPAGLPGGTGGIPLDGPSQRAYYPRLGSPEIGDIRGDYMREFRSTGIPPNPRDFNKAVQGSYDGVPNVSGRVNKTNAELTRFEKEMGRAPATDAEFEKFIFAKGKEGSIPKGTLGLAGMLSAGAAASGGNEAKGAEVHPDYPDRDTKGKFIPQN